MTAGLHPAREPLCIPNLKEGVLSGSQTLRLL